MKRIISLIILLLAITATTQAQTLQKFFDKYSDDERFQYVSVNKGIMNFASVFGGLAKDEQKIMAKMQGLKILTLEETNETPFLKEVFKELNEVIENGNFETAVEVRDKGERVQIYYRVVGVDNADMLIVTKEKNEFNCIWIKGKISKYEMMQSFSK